jgi:hypothetical protein
MMDDIVIGFFGVEGGFVGRAYREADALGVGLKVGFDLRKKMGLFVLNLNTFGVIELTETEAT